MGSGSRITYAPSFTINGSADKNTINKALQESMLVFERKFDNLIAKRKRLGYA
jgi:hypothetical protein